MAFVTRRKTVHPLNAFFLRFSRRGMETEEPERTELCQQGSAVYAIEVSNNANEDTCKVTGTSMVNELDVSLEPSESIELLSRNDWKNECSDKVGSNSNIYHRKSSDQTELPVDELQVDGGTMASHMQGDVAEISDQHAATTNFTKARDSETEATDITTTCDGGSEIAGVTGISDISVATAHGTAATTTGAIESSDNQSVRSDVTDTSESLIANTNVTEASDSIILKSDVMEASDSPTVTTGVTEISRSQVIGVDVTETRTCLTGTTGVEEGSESQDGSSGVTLTRESLTTITDVIEPYDIQADRNDFTETNGCQAKYTNAAMETCDSGVDMIGVNERSDCAAATSDVTATCDDHTGRSTTSVVQTSGNQSAANAESEQSVLTHVVDTAVGTALGSTTMVHSETPSSTQVLQGKDSACLEQSVASAASTQSLICHDAEKRTSHFGTPATKCFDCEDHSTRNALIGIHDSPGFDYRHQVVQPLYEYPQPDNQNCRSFEDEEFDVTQSDGRNCFGYSDQYPAYRPPEYHTNKKTNMETMSDLIRRQQGLLNKLFDMRINLRREERQLKTLKNELIFNHYTRWGDLESEFEV